MNLESHEATIDALEEYHLNPYFMMNSSDSDQQ